MSRGFRCKQFYVAHDQCAMKVSTDSLLLGAWSALPKQADTAAILDIGCGSGLLTLMLAQRLHSQNQPYQLTAVEIDAAATAQARQNCNDSPWSSHIEVVQADILTYASADLHAGRFDLIISNPPYFQNSLKSQRHAAQLARHDAALSLPALMQVSAYFAHRQSRLALVLPSQQAQQLMQSGDLHGWILERCCQVAERPGKAPGLYLLQWCRTPTPVESTQLLIRNDNGQYSDSYRSLLADFYLNF